MDSEESKDAHNLGKLVLSLMIVSFLGFMIFLGVRAYNNMATIKSNYNKTIGWIIEYHGRDASEVGQSNRVKYQYNVNGRLFTQKVTFVTPDIPNCAGSPMPEACMNMRFWVIYAKDDPSLSMISFEKDIQGQEHPQFPETLDLFRYEGTISLP
jgi:hypothetical protein